MKSRFLFITVTVAIALCTLAGTETNNQVAADREAGGLRTQVNELRARVLLLEARLSRLEAAAGEQKCEQVHPQSFPPPPPSPSIFGSPLNGEPLPEIWGKRQINGWTFYVVPCETGTKFSASATNGAR